MDAKQFETVIRANDKGLNFGEILKYKDLIFTFVRRNFVTLYKQTVLGPAWVLISPIITSIAFTIVFGQMANISTDGAPAILFYFAGNSLWMYFSSSFQSVSNTFIANAHIYGKVYFPRLIIPISLIITSFINFCVQIIMFIGCYIFYLFQGFEPNVTWAILYVPIILLQISILALSCGIIISSLTTKYRDLVFVVTFGLQLWMFLSPIVYPLSTSKGAIRSLLLLNPLTMPLETFKLLLLGTGTFNLFSFIFSWLVTIITFLIGIKLFNKIERTFVDTI